MSRSFCTPAESVEGVGWTGIAAGTKSFVIFSSGLLKRPRGVLQHSAASQNSFRSMELASSAPIAWGL